ncbi:MAG: hypothetical protein QGG48_01015 [Desulfatiglandales bacterium]|jgi:hypothetical protein|nr:hypothetical protein [Desulfatiglandales bacterium]
MGNNCNRDIGSISPTKAAGLFINYFNEQEVQSTMDHYFDAMLSQKGKACDMKEIQAFMLVLMEKLAHYIKLATPYTRPYSEK